MTRRPDDRLRVLFAVGGLGAGGSETQLSRLISEVHGRELEARLILVEPPQYSRRLERLRQVGVEPIVLGPLRGVHPVLDLARLGAAYVKTLRALRPDVVYPWLEETALFLVPAARAHRTAAVVARRNVSGANVEHAHPLGGLAVRRAEALAQVVTANSEAVAIAAINRGIDPRRIRVVANMHDPLPALPDPPDEPVVFGCLARLRPEKGHLRLLEAAAQVVAVGSWRLDLGGDGPLEGQLRRRAAELGLTERVRFLGDITDVRGFWRECHVGVLVSDHEGSPNALIEAALAGRPIVATMVGGSAELVRAGLGWGVDVRDVAGLAELLSRLVDERSLRSGAGAQAHRRASARFAIRPAVDGHLRAIRDALALG